MYLDSYVSRVSQDNMYSIFPLNYAPPPPLVCGQKEI